MISTKQTNILRESMVDELISMFTEKDYYEVLRVKSNEISIPFVTDDGEEGYYVITVKIPKGSRSGDAYDGYEEAEAYSMKLKEKEAKEKSKKEKSNG